MNYRKKRRRAKLILDVFSNSLPPRLKRRWFRLRYFAKRGYPIILLEHAKVFFRGNVVCYGISNNGIEKIMNIPYINTAVLMLGRGTSISNEAVRLFTSNNGIIFFTGGGGTPLEASTSEAFTVIDTNNEYRPTQYMQKWATLYFNEEKRLDLAKKLLYIRIKTTKKLWLDTPYEETLEFSLYQNKLNNLLNRFNNAIEFSKNTNILLSEEANFTKEIYKTLANHFSIDFRRDYNSHKNKKNDIQKNINDRLTESNYICYAFSASVLTTYGISYAFPILHGKTRRGGLVFDIADIIKDGFSIPLAFYNGYYDKDTSEYKKIVLKRAEELKIFDYLFKEVKKLIDF